MISYDQHLYSRLREDLQDKSDDCLIDPMGEPVQAMLNLIIFGVATPYLHNGNLILGDVEEGKGVSKIIYMFRVSSKSMTTGQEYTLMSPLHIIIIFGYVNSINY